MTFNKPNGQCFWAITRKEVRSFIKFVAQMLGKQFVLQKIGKRRHDFCAYIEEHHYRRTTEGKGTNSPTVTPE